MNNIVIKNIEPQSIKISGAGEVIGITAVYVNGVNVTEGSVAYVIVPTKTSQLENNSGFITQETDPTIPYYIKQIRLADITRWNNKQDELKSGVNIKTVNSNSLLGSGNIDISTSYSAGTGISISDENVISNDITSYNDLTDLPTIPDKTSDLLNDSDFVESSSLAEVAFNGSYLALSNTPEIPASTSELVNDGENGEDPFITNKTNSLENYYNIDYMWNLLPHVSDSDTTINLSPTVSDTALKMSLDPSTLSQDGTPTPSSPQDIHTISGSNTIKVNGKNLSTITSITTISGGYVNITNSEMTNVIQGKTYTLSFNNNSSYTNNCVVRIYYDGSNYENQTSSNLVANSKMTYTFTATKSGRLGLSCKVDNETTNIFTQIQVEIGNTATTYEPYVSQEADIDLGNIEYCKISTYEDRIFKNISTDPDYDNTKVEGGWYIKKNIGKLIFNGEEYWQESSYTNETIYSVYSNAINDYYGYTAFMSNLFPYNNNVSSATTTEYVSTGGNTIRIGVFKSRLNGNTINDFKTWLESNNTTIYYILNTPTYTQITGTLASQLDTIEDGLKAYNEQTNISQVNEDLPFVINADTLKSLSSL